MRIIISKSMEVITMSVKITSLAKGVSVGMVVGAATYALCCASSKDKRKLKSGAGKAMKAIGSMVEDFSNMF